MSKIKYDINWLKRKGFFKRAIPDKIDKKRVIFDLENKLAYVEVSDNWEVEKLRKIIVRDRRVRYVWFYKPINNSIKVHKKIGEVRWFHYNPNIARSRTDYHKSRQDKLNKFSPNNINILFDIKDVVNRFYNQLWKVRLEMAKSIGNQLEDDKNKLMVAQNFIDRLIFFYFLSQLGLVRIESEGLDEPWILNRENTRTFFKWVIDSVKDDYELQDFLNTLFFEVLGKVEYEVWNYSEAEINGEKFAIIGPSLNGGLFREEIVEDKHEREIRMKHIKELIKVLNQYNWIIGEEVPGEEDVIGDLTPEVIGHIYEKFVVSLEQMGFENIKLDDINVTKQELRKGRKKIGAYYTPEEITNYISMNTIYPYITDRINQKFGTKYKNIWNELLDDSTWRVIPKEREEKIRQIKYLYFDVLRNLKILDNACGSGSFLLAAADVLSRLYGKCISLLERYAHDDEAVKLLLEDINKAPNRDYYIARQIITNNLYGVDIMEGAVEIAKLRFWLYLISTLRKGNWDEIKIETLPNLDFNLMAGNSLIGFIDIEEFDLSPAIKTQKTIDLWIKAKKKIWLTKIGELKERYKKAHTEEARKLRKKLEDELNKARRILNSEYYRMLIDDRKIDISENEFRDLKPFHWGLEFYEIFNLDRPKEERGFDIIIGNPPYGRIKQLIKDKREKELHSKLYKALYKYQTGNFNLYKLFLERSYFLLREGGHFGMIFPSSFLGENDSKKLRKLFFDENQVSKILEFPEKAKVFVGVTQAVTIFIYTKKKPPEDYEVTIRTNISADEKGNLYSLTFLKVKKSELKELTGDEYRIPLFTNPKIEWEILKHISKYPPFRGDENNPPIGDVGEGHLHETFDKDFMSDEPGDDLLIKGIHLDRYFVNLDPKGPKPRWIKNKERFFQKKPAARDIVEYIPKVVGKEIQNMALKLRLNFAVLEKPFVMTNTIRYIIVKDKNINEYYFVALLNSKLLNWRFKLFSLTNHIKKYEIESLPIPRIPKEEQRPFIILSKYLHFLKQHQNYFAKDNIHIQYIIEYYENITDCLVYELYLGDVVRIPIKDLVKDKLEDIELPSNLLEEDKKKIGTIFLTIESVFRRLEADKKLNENLYLIKLHPWVKQIYTALG